MTAPLAPGAPPDTALPTPIRQALRAGSRLALAGLVVLAPLAAGSTRTELRLAAAAVALLALLAGALGSTRRGLRLPAVVWPFVALAGLIGLQLVPLPPDLSGALSPEARAIRDRVLAGLAGWPGAAPLSLDPTATLRALFDQLAFLAVLVLSLNLDRDRRRPLAALLVALGVAVSAVGCLHWALELPKMYGIYTPIDRAVLRGFSAPFVNPNHSAGLLVLTTGAALGLLADGDQDRGARLGLLGITAGIVGVVLSGSRGGLGALLLLFVVFALLAAGRPPGGHLETPRRRARAVAKVTVILGLLAAVAAVLLMPDWRTAGPGVTDEIRFGLWRGALDQARAFWLTGVGRGAFGAVHPRFQSVAVEGTVSHPENHGLQLATEVGLPGLLLGVGGALWLWHRCRRGVGRQADPLHWGLLAGLVGLGAQQLFDFGLEAPGLALPTALVVGLVVGRGQPVRTDRGRPHPWLAWGLAAGAALALAGLALAAGPLRHHAPRAEIAALQAAAGPGVDVAALPAAAAAALTRHPADYLVALAAAGALAARPETPLPTALAWLNKAMYLGPTDARAHLLAARLFLRVGHPAQAASEYRRALGVAPWRRTVVVAEVARHLTDPRHLAQAVPPDAAMRLNLGEALLSRNPARARAVMDHLLLAAEAEALLAAEAPTGGATPTTGSAPAPGSAPARLTPPGQLALHQVRARACLELGDLPCAGADIEKLAQGGDAHLAWALRAQYALAQNRPDDARTALAAGLGAGARDPAFLRTVAVVSLRLGDVPEARDAAARLWRQVAHDPRQAAQTLALQARIEERAGDDATALRAWQRAIEADPTVESVLAGAARAEALRQLAEARRMARLGLDHWPQEPRIQALLARLDRADPSAPQPSVSQPGAPASSPP